MLLALLLLLLLLLLLQLLLVTVLFDEEADDEEFLGDDESTMFRLQMPVSTPLSASLKTLSLSRSDTIDDEPNGGSLSVNWSMFIDDEEETLCDELIDEGLGMFGFVVDESSRSESLVDSCCC